MAEKIPIFLGVAGPGSPHGVDGLEADLLDHIEFRLGLPHHPASKVLPFGQTSGCHGVEEARCVLAAGEAPFCVVAGVDCYLWQNVISAYIEQRRVMTETNSNGFFPGEAGTAVLVGVAATTAPRLIIAGVGAAQEDGTPTSERPLRAEGLTDAMRQALAQAGLTLTDVAYRITDLTGEHYKFKEAAFAAGRLDSGIRREHLELWHPVEFLGEVGAAIFPCMLGVALHAARNGYAPGRTVLCHAGNEAGERTAMVLTFTAGREAL